MRSISENLAWIFGAGALLALVSAELSFMGWLWINSV
jgi:hypothetical protein